MNKKVLLSVLSAGLVATTVAPLALAQGENASNSNQLTQKKYVSERDIADEANAQVAAHEAEIRAEAQRQFDQQGSQALKAAQAELKAFLDSGYSGHDFTTKKEALEAKVAAAKATAGRSFDEIYNTVKNRYVQKLQEQYRAAAVRQGNYWNDKTGVEDNKPNPTRIAEDIKNQTGKDVTVEKKQDGSVVIKDQKGNVLKTITKDGKVMNGPVKANRVLPKTHAAK
ncbi:amylase-binding adhesin AbpA [Gemella haemolysans]|uniref:Amylase-binding adhesin AbpA n=1 Tax=Gemella haemolysans TaxID=1379 RepID=A0AAW6B6F4_9BACL|nr:amylase-binding adhesin AbpA [Gemella haemolysans]MDB6185844.1 amylase-binding adhesin AbpA [Gemella haemolysans]MDB6212977.1 amylase-binding adhesin AbpA [Gemella haemolysans]